MDGVRYFKTLSVECIIHKLVQIIELLVKAHAKVDMTSSKDAATAIGECSATGVLLLKSQICDAPSRNRTQIQTAPGSGGAREPRRVC